MNYISTNTGNMIRRNRCQQPNSEEQFNDIGHRIVQSSLHCNNYHACYLYWSIVIVKPLQWHRKISDHALNCSTIQLRVSCIVNDESPSVKVGMTPQSAELLPVTTSSGRVVKPP